VARLDLPSAPSRGAVANLYIGRMEVLDHLVESWLGRCVGRWSTRRREPVPMLGQRLELQQRWLRSQTACFCQRRAVRRGGFRCRVRVAFRPDRGAAPRPLKFNAKHRRLHVPPFSNARAVQHHGARSISSSIIIDRGARQIWTFGFLIVAPIANRCRHLDPRRGFRPGGSLSAWCSPPRARVILEAADGFETFELATDHGPLVLAVLI
jgi:hypothetical protein